MSFFEKINTAIANNQSLLVVALDPNPEMMPQRFQSGDDNLIQDLAKWLKFVIQSTCDAVCAYKPTLSFYIALGAPGLDLLRDILQTIPESIPVILDAKHSDLNSSTIFAKTVFTDWKVDAITINPYPGQDQVAPFLVHPGKAVFILCRTSNPAATVLQEYPLIQDEYSTLDENNTKPELPLPFYLQVVERAKNWGTPEQLGLEVGTTEAEVIQKIRAIAPERLILARSIWAENSNLEQILAAGINANGDGLLIPVPQDLLANPDLKVAINSLNQQINQARNKAIQGDSSCELWMPDVCLFQPHPYQDLILQLYDIGCILFGDYVQASGATFSYYIDLRKIISKPQVFNKVLNAYADVLKTLDFDRIAGIPYGSLPTATGLSLRLNYPMIFPRKEVKAHGTRKVIEGNFEAGETVVVVDDILISGKSVMEGAAKLESGGLIVEDIVVFIDHEGNVKQKLGDNGYRAHSVLGISEITETLHAAGRITDEQYSRFEH